LYAPSGGAADEMSAGDSIVFAGVRYYVRQTEPVYFGGETVYHKAYLLKEQEGEY